MTLKLSSSEFTALHFLLQKCIDQVNPKGIQTVLLHGVLTGLYKKFYIRAFEKKNRYTVHFSSHEACAFFMFFSLYPMDDEDLFTVNLVMTINRTIHQKFNQ